MKNNTLPSLSHEVKLLGSNQLDEVFGHGCMVIGIVIGTWINK
jgi:hypothetical protein